MIMKSTLSSSAWRIFENILGKEEEASVILSFAQNLYFE